MMSVNPLDEKLRSLTTVKAMVRKEIDTTKSLDKKEVYRKRYEEINKEITDILNIMKLEIE